MNQKAQFFIIGVVILGILILGAATIWNVFLPKNEIARQKFETLCENYKHEVFEISKYAVKIGNKTGEEAMIKNFTIQFLNATEPLLLLYVYGNKTRLFIFNATNSSLIVKDQANNDVVVNWITINGFSYGEVSNIDVLNITIQNKKINKIYTIQEEEIFYFVMIEEKNNERYICE